MVEFSAWVAAVAVAVAAWTDPWASTHSTAIILGSFTVLAVGTGIAIHRRFATPAPATDEGTRTPS